MIQKGYVILSEIKELNVLAYKKLMEAKNKSLKARTDMESKNVELLNLEYEYNYLKQKIVEVKTSE